MPTPAPPPPAARSSSSPWFHEFTLLDVWALRKRTGTRFDLAECATRRPPCVPRYLRSWQAAITGALNGTSLRWRTCAVVGSSNSLMHTARGQAIDTAEAVYVEGREPMPRCRERRRNDPAFESHSFRVNGAPTRGYEVHVGTRTTLRFWGVEGAPGPTTPVVWGTTPKLPAASEPGTFPAVACPAGTQSHGRCCHGLLRPACCHTTSTAR